MYKLELTILQQKVLRFLFIHAGESFTARAISKSLGVSQPGLSKSLPGLKKIGFVNVLKDRESKRLTIKLNRDSQLAIGIKRADNLMQIYESGIVSFLEEYLPGATIILFGSYSRGDDTNVSDIDIAVIGRKEKEVDTTIYERVLQRKINLQFYSSMSSVQKELRENLCNGIIIAGSVEL